MHSQSSGRTLVLVGVFVAIALMLAIPVRTWLSQRAELADLQAQNDAAQARVNDLSALDARWRDPEYIKARARQRLNLVNQGESGLIVLNPAGTADQATEAAPATTWYDRLWRSTDSAAGRRPSDLVGNQVPSSP